MTGATYAVCGPGGVDRTQGSGQSSGAQNQHLQWYAVVVVRRRRMPLVLVGARDEAQSKHSAVTSAEDFTVPFFVSAVVILQST